MKRHAPAARADVPAPAAGSALPAGPGRQPGAPFGWRFVAPLMTGAALNPVNSSLIATALVPIGRAFGIPLGRTAVLVAVLYLASAIAQPASGKLAEHLGPRRVFLAGIVIVLAAGILGGTARSFTVVLAARVLIGIGTSAGYPTAMLLIRARTADAGLREPPGGVLAALSVTGQATAAAGLPLGGLLVGAAGWRAAFLINLPFALAALVLALAYVPADNPREHGDAGWRRAARICGELDIVGMLLFAAAVTALLVFLLSLAHPDWAALAVTAAAAGGLSWWELRAATPFLDLRALAARPALAATYARSGVTFLIIYTILYGITQWLQAGPGLSATSAGLAMLPSAAIAVAVSVPAGRRNLVRVPLVAAAGAAVTGSAGLAVLPADVVVVILITLIFGVTVGLGSVANQAALYAQAPGGELGTDSGLLRTFNYLGAIGSTAVISAAFRHGATSHGLHVIGLVLLPLSAAVLAATLAARTLPRFLPGADASTGETKEIAS
jgi:MFS family permease